MIPQRIEKSATTTLDGSGNGQVEIRAPISVEWRITRSSVLLSNPLPTSMPTIHLYRNSINPATFIDGSYSGALNTSDMEYVIPAGDAVIAVWEGGDANLTATLRISGMQYPIGYLERG